MAPSRCTEIPLREQAQLLQIAREAIAGSFRDSGQIDTLVAQFEGILVERRGVFVTLTKSGALRGCIGTIEARETLLVAVADCARGAAFRDPRFPPIQEEELAELQVEVSVLTSPQSMAVSTRVELLETLRPSVDGLLLEDGMRRSTFLPQVWEQLPDPEQFLSHLLQKAGLPGDYWSKNMRCSRYQSTSIREQDLSLNLSIHELVNAVKI